MYRLAIAGPSRQEGSDSCGDLLALAMDVEAGHPRPKIGRVNATQMLREDRRFAYRCGTLTTRKVVRGSQ